jgi:hypothetical protein
VTLSLGDYRKGFKSLYTILAGCPFIPPLVKAAFGEGYKSAALMYPPLGSFEGIGIVATLFAVLISLYIVYFYRSRTSVHGAVPAVLTVLFMAGGIGLIFLYQFFVKVVHVPSIGRDVVVSIGYVHNNLVNANHPREPDDRILYDYAGSESGVQRLYTRSSIATVRAALWATYTLVMFCIGSFAGLAAYEHALKAGTHHPAAKH